MGLTQLTNIFQSLKVNEIMRSTCGPFHFHQAFQIHHCYRQICEQPFLPRVFVGMREVKGLRNKNIHRKTAMNVAPHLKNEHVLLLNPRFPDSFVAKIFNSHR